MTREMKNSGVEWMGEIPNIWEVVPSNMVFYNSTIKTEEGVEQLTASQKYGVISQNRFMKLETQTPVQKQNLNDLKKVSKGDFVISLRSFQGGIEIAQESGGITPAYTVLKERTSKTYDGYYKYLFKSEMYIQALRGTVLDTIRDGKAVRFSNFSMVPILLPPKNEQAKIALFLDETVGKINMVISETQQSIEDLNRYKQSLISEIITNGLDKDAGMRDSGIEWVGKIPRNWKISKSRFFLKEVSEKNHPSEMILSLYRDYGVIPKNSRDDNHNVTSLNTSGYKFVKKNQLVINKMKAWQGSMAISGFQGIISPAYFIYEIVDASIYLPFLNYALRNVAYLDEYRRISMGLRIGQWDLNKDQFKNLKFVFPESKQEQIEIVEYLDGMAINIDNLIIEKKQLVSEFEQYKKSLIYEYITGKKEV